MQLSETDKIFETDDIKTIEALLSDPSFDINYTDTNGNNLLHHACLKNKIEIARLLINNTRFDGINKRNSYYHTPLIICSCRGKYEIAKMLIEISKFTSLNDFDHGGYTAFHYACLFGHKDIVELLINTKGFDSLNRKNYSNNTGFHFLCQEGNYDMVELLIKTPGFNSLVTENSEGMTPFHNACRSGHTKIVELLIRTPGFDSLNKKSFLGYVPLRYAYRNKHIDVVKELLKQPDIIIPDNLNQLDILEKQIESIRKEKKIDIKIKLEHLIESYKNNPNYTRIKLLLEDNIDVYRLIVFLSDDYFVLKSDTENTNGYHFMNITKRLPIELQMVVVLRSCGLSINNISAKLFNDGLQEFVNKFLV